MSNWRQIFSWEVFRERKQRGARHYEFPFGFNPKAVVIDVSDEFTDDTTDEWIDMVEEIYGTQSWSVPPRRKTYWFYVSIPGDRSVGIWDASAEVSITDSAIDDLAEEWREYLASFYDTDLKNVWTKPEYDKLIAEEKRTDDYLNSMEPG